MSRIAHISSHRHVFVVLGAAVGLAIGAATAQAQEVTDERALLNRMSSAFTSQPGIANPTVIDGAAALLGTAAARRVEFATSSVAVAPGIDGAGALLGRRTVRAGSGASPRSTSFF